MTSLAAGVVLIGASSIMGAVNVVTTVMTMRTRGMTWTRLPMTVWGIMGAALLAAIGTSSFSADLVLIILDRAYKTSFFFYQVGGDAVGAGGGNAWLAQNLFWFFGHPEVYLIVLPAFGIVIDILVVFGRKPLFGYKTAVLGIMGVVVLSFLVWAHHEFVSGWAPEIRPFYMATTEMISIPTGLVFLVALGTLWRGRLWMTTAMLFALSFIWNFLIGGISGIFLSDVPADVQLHGGMFVTAHFHFTMVGGALMGFFAAVYFWFPKMTGRMMDERLGKIHFWGTQIGFNVAFLAMMYAGLQGMPRRVADYAPLFAGANFITSIFAYLLAASIIVFFYNVIASWIAGEKAVANPWGAKSLEWLVPTPVPLENFEEMPVVASGPYDYGEPVGTSVPAAGGGSAGQAAG
jgi:cytochrome c oxidase subunit 1